MGGGPKQATRSLSGAQKSPRSRILKYLQNYLDEYVFRFNRRKSKFIGKKFMRIVQQVVKSVKVTYREIKWDIDPIFEYYAT
jgi:hypothetical protein